MNILVIDDDPLFNQIIANFLERGRYQVETTINPQKGIQLLQKKQFNLVIVDYKLPGTDGLEIITHIKTNYPTIPVILSTNYADIRVAVNSIKLGAFEFISKPIIPDELLKVVKMALIEHNQDEKRLLHDTPVKEISTFVIGNNEATKKLWEHIHLVSPTKLNVLILGESGTGKEHVAQTIHQKSKRHTKNFIALDCGALTAELAASELFGHIKGAFTGALNTKKGLFEEANGGTLFLDEIGNLPYDIQTSLLRTIQEGKIKRVGDTKEISVDVRIIAATNSNLNKESLDQTFRLDLFHRLNEFELIVPPLRDRLEDLDVYASFFIDLACKEFDKPRMKVSPEARQVFLRYSWPGNLRELKNILRRAVLLSNSETILIDVLPKGILETPQKSSELDSTLSIKDNNYVQERELIIQALEQCRFNKSKAAEMLGIDRTTLYKKLKLYKIEY